MLSSKSTSVPRCWAAAAARAQWPAWTGLKDPGSMAAGLRAGAELPSGPMHRRSAWPAKNALVSGAASMAFFPKRAVLHQKVLFRGLDHLEGLGRRLRLAQIIGETRPQQQPRQPRQHAQMGAVIATADQEEQVGKAPVRRPEGD